MTGQSPAELLCLSCGMCCSGTLHNWTNLRDQERVKAQRAGLEVFCRRDGTAAFRQPCAAFEAPACTIYNQRPQACQDYACSLLKRLINGETNLEEALEHTHRVRELIAQLQSQMPEKMDGLPLVWQVRLSWPPSDELPAAVQPIFKQLTALLYDVWQVKWKRNSSTEKGRKKR